MVRQRRTDRCFLPAAGNGVARVQVPVSPAERRQQPPPAERRQQPPPAEASQRKRVGAGAAGAGGRPGRTTSSAATTEGNRGDLGPDRDPGETESKRLRQDGCEEAAALSSRQDVLGSRDPSGGDDQQGAAEHHEDNRAAELQSVRSLKVTIQQSSESREFGQTDRTADRQTGGLHCHVCNLTCRSLQMFQEHMSGSEHLRKLQEITHSICLNAHTLQYRGRRPDPRCWCDTCQTHFSGDVIAHRRTKQHKMCKQLCRPFCPVCKRHFRTPRKFVEHVKSAEHKQQVRLDEAQEEELITVDAVGCFEEEEEEEEEEVDVADEEDEDVGKEEAEDKTLEETDGGGYDPHTPHGSSFVVPVSGFLCQLCSKFFYRETTARHTHCRTHAHYLNLQRHRSRRSTSDPEGGAGT